MSAAVCPGNRTLAWAAAVGVGAGHTASPLVNADHVLRVARPTDNLATVAAMYAAGEAEQAASGAGDAGQGDSDDDVVDAEIVDDEGEGETK